MEHYSVIRKMEMMPFAATWRDIEIIILSEVSRRKINIKCYHLYVESSLKDTNELISKTEIDLQTQKINLWLPNNQRGPTVQHRELNSVFCNNLQGERVWKYVCVFK